MARITIIILLVMILSCRASKFNQEFDSVSSIEGYWGLTSINHKSGAAYPNIHFFKTGDGVLIQSLTHRYDFYYKIDSVYVEIKFEEGPSYLNEELFYYTFFEEKPKLTTLILKSKDGKGNYILVRDDSAQ